MAREDQVRRRRDGQELGDPFDDAEQRAREGIERRRGTVAASRAAFTEAEDRVIGARIVGSGGYHRARRRKRPRTGRRSGRARTARARRRRRASLIECHSASSVSSRIAAADIPSTSPTAQSTPVSPSRTTSGSPPAREPITGTPDGERLERAQAERLALRWAAGTDPRPRAAARPRRSCRGRTRRPATPSRRASCSASTRSGPSPTITSTLGTCFAHPREDPAPRRGRASPARKFEMCISTLRAASPAREACGA